MECRIERIKQSAYFKIMQITENILVHLYQIIRKNSKDPQILQMPVNLVLLYSLLHFIIHS